MYRKRTAQINGEQYSDPCGIIASIGFYVEFLFNICFHLINRNNRASIAVLEIEGVTAAMMILFREHDGVIVPKLAINTDFSRYSPGHVLISEYFKSRSSQFVFDLSRGAEQYKTALGGSVYYNYGFEIQL